MTIDASGTVATMCSASEHTGSVLLDIPWPLNVFTVVAPVPRGAEPLGAQNPVIDAGHLDAIIGLKDVLATCQVLLSHLQSWVPELSAGEIV